MSVCNNSSSWGIWSSCGIGSILIACCLGLAACGTTTTQSFVETKNPDIDASYIATDADFSKYHRIVADEMGIFFPQSVGLGTEELTRIRQIFRDTFRTELQNYEIVQESGPGTLLVQASLIDLRNSAASDVPNLRAELRSAARSGELLFLMELRDSESNHVLGRAADGVKTPRFASASQNNTDWGSVESAARHWASLFRSFLDQNLGK